MTYIELINNFWEQFDNEGMTPTDVLLYFYLLKECNRKMWQPTFSLPNKKIMVALDITEKSLIASRKRLASRGLINVKKGDRNCAAPEYTIAGVENTDFNFPTESRMADERQMNGRRKAEERQMNGGRTGDERQKSGRRMAALYKTKDYRLKDYTSPEGDVIFATQRDAEMQPDEVTNEVKQKPKRAKAPHSQPPTLEEILAYFSSQDADKQLDNWQESAKRFFDHFTAVGWRDKYNRRIARWESRANSWIFDDKHKQTTNTQGNGSYKTDKFSERRGTEPSAQRPKDYQESFFT